MEGEGAPRPAVNKPEAPKPKPEAQLRVPDRSAVLFNGLASSADARLLRRTGTRMLKDAANEQGQVDGHRVDVASQVIGLGLFVDGDIEGNIPQGMYVKTAVKSEDQALHEYRIMKVNAGENFVVVGDEVVRDEKSGKFTVVRPGVELPLEDLRNEAMSNVRALLADPDALTAAGMSPAEQAYVSALVNPAGKSTEATPQPPTQPEAETTQQPEATPTQQPEPQSAEAESNAPAAEPESSTPAKPTAEPAENPPPEPQTETTPGETQQPTEPTQPEANQEPAAAAEPEQAAEPQDESTVEPAQQQQEVHPTPPDIKKLREAVITEGKWPSGTQWFGPTFGRLPESAQKHIIETYGQEAVDQLSSASVMRPDQTALAFQIFGYPLDRANVKGIMRDLDALAHAESGTPENRAYYSRLLGQVQTVYNTTMTRTGIGEGRTAELSSQNFTSEAFIQEWYRAMESGVDTFTIDDIRQLQTASPADLEKWDNMKLNALLALAALFNKLSEKVNQMSAEARAGGSR